jgi:hypothetical protein
VVRLDGSAEQLAERVGGSAWEWDERTRQSYLHIFTRGQPDLNQFVDDYNFDRPHHGRLTRGRIPADIVYGANKVKTR